MKAETESLMLCRSDSESNDEAIALASDRILGSGLRNIISKLPASSQLGIRGFSN